MSVNIYNSVTGDLTTVADSIDSLEKVSALPSVTTDLIGKIYLLTDEQTGYKKGGIYECQAITVTPVGTEDPSEEGWYEYVGGEYVLSADTTVDSSKTYYSIEWVLISSSGDTNIFNGTLQEWALLSAEEKANYSHIATPEEADVTGSYSTTETKTGAIWIDGKPIYRKCYTSLASITSAYQNLTIVGDIDNIIYGDYHASNNVHNTTLQYMMQNGYVVVSHTGQVTYNVDCIWLEYTKTTD